MGLADIYESESWRAMPEIAERTAYALESMVGGQGKRKKGDKGYCNCKKGKCASQKCVCKVGFAVLGVTGVLTTLNAPIMEKVLIVDLRNYMGLF